MRQLLSVFVAGSFLLSTIGCGVDINVDDDGVRIKAPGVDIDVSDENGVNVEAPGVDISVKEDDVKVKAPGVEIKVDENNVEVDAPGTDIKVNKKPGDSTGKENPENEDN